MRSDKPQWCLIWWAWAMVLGGAALGWADEPKSAPSAEERPPWQRMLQGDDVKQADTLQARIDKHLQAGTCTEAVGPAQELLALREKVQGKDHWQTANARWQIIKLERLAAGTERQRGDFVRGLRLAQEAWALEEKFRHAQAQPLREEILAITRKTLGEDHPDTADRLNFLAINLNAQGKHAEAEKSYRAALAIWLKALGENHPNTAVAYHNLASNQVDQAKYAEGEKYHRKALAIRLQTLGDNHLDTAGSYDSLALNQNAQGKYTAAEQGYRKALAIRIKILGEEHVQIAQSLNNLGENLISQAKHAAADAAFHKALAIVRKTLGEEHPHTAIVYDNLASNLNNQARYADAEKGFRKALDIRRKVLGEEHLSTALSYNNLAANQDSQGKYGEAETSYRKALDIWRKKLGEAHDRTATGYNNLAYNLNAQGKYADAERGYRKALEIRRQVLGEDHPDTAVSYNNLAFNQNEQGHLAEAAAGLRKALDIFRKALGEDHPTTATSYSNVAKNLDAQTRFAEAEPGLRKALDIHRRILGEWHPDTAAGHNNLAFNQYNQGRYAEAEEGFRKALSIQRWMLGDKHPNTALCYSNLALSQVAQGKEAEAQAGFEKALAIRRKALGEAHPETATSYNNLASLQARQRHYTEAEASFRKALEVWCSTLGDQHPITAQGFLNLATNLAAQRRFDAAEELLIRAVDGFAHARLRLASAGLDRAISWGEESPSPLLAALLARRGQPEQAWQRFEEGLGQATWDEMTTRLGRSPEDRAPLAMLARRLEGLDQLLERHASLKEPNAEQIGQHKELLSQHRKTQEELDALVRELAKSQGLARQAATLAQVQTALPADAALIGWIDVQAHGQAEDDLSEHWAVLVRSRGAPVWISLKGSGTGPAWSGADERLPLDLISAMIKRPTRETADWRPLAQRLERQRLQPLAQHLGATADLPAVRHLLVLPSSLMDFVPLDVLTDRYTFTRLPSATVFASLRSKGKPTSQGLLTLADPIFDRPHSGKPPPLPPGGLLLTSVSPESNAARAGLRVGDVLLQYAGKPVASVADLTTLMNAAGNDPKGRVAVEVWHNGDRSVVEIAPGRMGIVLAKEPAPEAIAARCRDADLAAGRGDDGWKELPGTRIEAQALIRRFRTARLPTTALFDSDASEQRLAELVKDGTLARTRYLHLATHGTFKIGFTSQAAVILARDRLPDPARQLNAGLSVYDGRLTAAEVLRDWDLDADLVTLSACTTGLGRFARGEGFLGFAQVLLVAGSRSVCLSLWQVDDAATALLMDRFYANLLGQREGLMAPLDKAEALAEAKRWLRALPRSEALKLTAQLTAGVERGKGQPALPVVPAVPETERENEPPYAHPFYWAAFVLVGDKS